MPTTPTRHPSSASRTSSGRQTSNGTGSRQATSGNGNGSSRASTNRTRTSPEPRLGQQDGELQRFGSLRQLPIALSAEARTESCQLLNEILSDTMILTALYKKSHWNVAGPTFYQLHLLFDKHAEEQLELVDLVAERVQTLGGISVGDPRHAAELTTIPRPPDGAEEVSVMIDRTLRAHETIIEKVRAGIDATEESGDWGSNDLLMSDVLRRNELQVWFVSEHVVDVPLVGD
jgi:starvation-inducible DNA-binding protein